MRTRFVIACAAFALAGCGTAPTAPMTAPVPAPVQTPVCAPFRAWSDADLKALGKALEPVPADSIVMRMALDWRRYYGDAKACAAK
jgi:hypothetical protein